MTQPSTTAILRDIAGRTTGDTTLGELIAALGERSFGLAILILALPNTIPLVPGFASVCAIPMCIIALQLLCGCTCIRLPARFARIRINCATLSRLLQRCLPMLHRIEHLIKPRLPIFHSPLAEKIIALQWIILAFVIFLPIPFGDPFPAFCASLLALGMLEKDGALIALGTLSAIATVYAMAYLITSLLAYAWQAAVNLL